MPGPTSYNIPSKLKETPEYGFGLRPFIDPQKNRTTTGPGFYDPKYFDSKRTIQLMGKPRDNPNMWQPGPGAYNDMR